MKMDFVVLSQLLKPSHSLLKSGYLAFICSIIVLSLFSQLKVMVLFVLMLIFGLMAVHHYLFIRIEFDQGLLSYLSKNGNNQTEIEYLTQQLDQSLLNLKLIPMDKTARDWSLRFQGCLKLFKFQMAIVLIQYLVLMLLFYQLSNK